MNIYFGHFVFLCLLSVLFSTFYYGNRNLKNSLFILGCLSLLFLTAFRDISIGADTENYCNNFQYIRKFLSWKEVFAWKWEPGYVLINKILGLFFENSQALIIALALIILLPLFRRIKKDSLLPCMSLLVFVSIGIWQASTFVYRQWCAIAILTFSYKYIQERRLAPFLLLLFCAMLFHRTAVVFILVYLFYDLKINGFVISLSLMFSVLLGLIGKPILYILNHFARLPEKEYYNGGMNLLLFLWACVIIVYIFAKKEIKKPVFKQYYIMLLIAAVLQPIVFTFSLWSRVVIYFMLSIIVILPNTFYKILFNKKNRQWTFFLEISLYAFLFVWYSMGGLEEYLFVKIC